jgi:hypothetical protein
MPVEGKEEQGVMEVKEPRDAREKTAWILVSFNLGLTVRMVDPAATVATVRSEARVAKGVTSRSLSMKKTWTSYS